MTAGADVGTRLDGIVPIFVALPPADIALVKFVFESYEGVAVIRTIDRHAAVIVAMASTDFADTARAILGSLSSGVDLREIEPPPEVGDEWTMRHVLLLEGDGGPPS